ncbi:MAG: hypothetical protein PVJ83_08405, partial [Gammaproteobacteria bacterium]
MAIEVSAIAGESVIKRPGRDDVVEVPKFLAGIDSLNGRKSLLAGFMMVVLNPKNLSLCAAGAAAIGLNPHVSPNFSRSGLSFAPTGNIRSV